jgi:hypothetical protein
VRAGASAPPQSSGSCPARDTPPPANDTSGPIPSFESDSAGPPTVSAAGNDSGSSSESDDEPQIDPVEIARRYDMFQAMSTAYDEMENQDDEDSVDGDNDNDNSEASPATENVPSASNSGDDYLSISAAIMTEASADERGTVQALARELDEVRADGES